MPHGRVPAAASASHTAAAPAAGTWRTKPGPRSSLARCARQARGVGQQPGGAGSLDPDQGEGLARLSQLDVVGDDELLERLHERRARPHVHVEEERIPERGHPQVGRDPPLDGEEQRGAARPWSERRDVVAEHAVEERHPVRTRRAHDGAEAQVDERRTLAQRRILGRGVGAEAARQHDATLLAVHGAAPGEMRVQRGLEHRA